MIGKKPAEYQMSIFEVALESFIDMNHELVVLSNQIDWSEVESDFSEYYCADNGRPSVPIRTMVNDIARKMDAFQLEQYGKDQILRLTGYVPKEALTDRGYRGKKRVGDMAVSIPTSGTPGQSYYQKRKARKKFCKRAGIESVIGHLKSDHRMMLNYLKGTLGDAINTMMAAAAYNMRHWMNKNALSFFVSWLRALVGCLENVILANEKQYAGLYQTLAIVAE